MGYRGLTIGQRLNPEIVNRALDLGVPKQVDYRILDAGRVTLKKSLISAGVNKGISRRRYFFLVKQSG